MSTRLSDTRVANLVRLGHLFEATPSHPFWTTRNRASR